jgi:erythromycin esterase
MNSVHRLSISCLLGGLCYAVCSIPVRAQSGPYPEVISWVQAHSFPVGSLAATTQEFELERFRPIIGNARVIALGEAAHGVEEFLAFRNEFAEFLIEKMGLTGIAAETGYSESIAVDDYIQGRTQLNPETTGSVFSWSRSVAYLENQRLIDFLRDYNSRPTTTRKIHFYGVDLTGGRGGPFSEARIALDSALAYVDRVDTTQSRQLRSRLAPFLPRFNSASHDSLTAGERDALTAVIGDLISLFERRQGKWPARRTAESYDRAYHQAVVARELDANFRAAATESNPQAQREIAMAQNLQWVLDREGAHGRLLLFEANWHVSKGPISTDVWGTSLGEHLTTMLGTDYVSIGATYSRSEGFGENALPIPDTSSVAAMMARAQARPAVLSLRDLPRTGPVADWFQASRNVVAGRIDRMVVSRAFDAVLFIPIVHPAAAAN